MRNVKLAVILAGVSLAVVGLVVAHGHGHAHDHGHAHGNDEPPSFKYSRQANEQPAEHQNHGHGHAHDHGHGHGHAQEQPKAEKAEAQAQAQSQRSHQQQKKQEAPRDRITITVHAILSTLLISIAPFVILFFIPLKDNGIENQSLLKVLLAFASGSLLGDAFLHLIPHALNPHDHHQDGEGHGHSHGAAEGSHDHSAQITVGLWVLAGLLTFLLVEKVVRNLNGVGAHVHSHASAAKKEIKAEEKKEAKKVPAKEESAAKEKKEVAVVENDKKQGQTDEIQVAGYLNLAADFAHNFTDGLAIGASFLAGQNIGLVTTLTILFHEVPHEIGDFAILIQSGCSKRKAIYLQLLTALGAVSGTLFSLLFESAVKGFATACILPFTAGGFIYIATVTIMPELKEEASGIWQTVKEMFAILVGIAMMVVIAYIE